MNEQSDMNEQLEQNKYPVNDLKSEVARKKDTAREQLPIEGQLSTDAAGSQHIIHIAQTVPQPNKAWRFVKRGLLAMVMPLLLLLISGAFLAFLGQGALITLNQTISKFWWIATFFRLVVYAIVCWFMLPHILKKKRREALNNIDEARMALFSDGVADVHKIQELEQRFERISNVRINPLTLLIVLLIFDVVALQLPYLFK